MPCPPGGSASAPLPCAHPAPGSCPSSSPCSAAAVGGRLPRPGELQGLPPRRPTTPGSSPSMPAPLDSLSDAQQKDARCLSCHAPDQAEQGMADVTCETCHGGGQYYSPAYVMKDPELARLVGLRGPVREAVPHLPRRLLALPPALQLRGVAQGDRPLVRRARREARHARRAPRPSRAQEEPRDQRPRRPLRHHRAWSPRATRRPCSPRWPSSGRSNVGKSSMINALTGRARSWCASPTPRAAPARSTSSTWTLERDERAPQGAPRGPARLRLRQGQQGRARRSGRR